jgi:outer membrane protein assembly factor BamB
MKYILTFLAVLFLTTLVNAQNGIGTSSAMFHSNNNEYNHSLIQKYNPLGDVKWKFKTGGKVFSSPAVLNDIAVIGSEDKNLYAIDIKTGREKWKFTTGGAVHSSPAICNNTVYFESLDGYFYALDFTTGQRKWKFKTGGEKRIGDTSYWGMKPAGMYMEDPWDCFLSSPIVDKNSKDPIVYFGSSDGNLYAINAKDGSPLWKFKAKSSIHASPALYKGILYFGSWDTYFYAINAKTGKEVWKFKTGEQVAMSGIQVSATVENGIVYFGARDAHMYALNAYNGNLIWKYDTRGSWIISSAVIKKGVLYVGTSDTYLLLALDIKTGKEKYRFKTNGYVFGTPALVGNTAYFGDFTGKMYALDLTSRGKRWNSISTEARNQNAASILKNDTLNFIFAAKDNDLSFYASNVKVMDDFYMLGSIVSSPVVKKNVIYFGSADGNLYALNLIENKN